MWLLQATSSNLPWKKLWIHPLSTPFNSPLPKALKKHQKNSACYSTRLYVLSYCAHYAFEIIILLYATSQPTLLPSRQVRSTQHTFIPCDEINGTFVITANRIQILMILARFGMEEVIRMSMRWCLPGRNRTTFLKNKYINIDAFSTVGSLSSTM